MCKMLVFFSTEFRFFYEGESVKNAKRSLSNFMRLEQGWATVLVSGPHVGKRCPSRTGLLDGLSLICSTTIIVRVTLIGKQKKRSTHSSDVVLSIENIGEAVA